MVCIDLATMTTKKTTKKKTSAKPKAKKPAAKKKASKPAVKEQPTTKEIEHEKAHDVALSSIPKSQPLTVENVLLHVSKAEPKKKKSLWRRIVGFGF